MEIAITAIGTANPSFCQEQNKVIEFMMNTLSLSSVEKRRLKVIYHATGIQNRYSVLEDFTKLSGPLDFFSKEDDQFPTTKHRMFIYKQNALPLALQAIHNCFANLDNFNPHSITHLITVSCTGMSAPGLDIEIVQHLKLPNSTHRTTINFMGCYGVFNGIKCATAICKAYPNAKVLVVSVELCTLHFQKSNSLDNMISSAIFADGAGAVLIEANPTQYKYFTCDNFYCDLMSERGGGQAMTWEIADHGFDIVLSSYVPQLLEVGIKHFIEKLNQVFIMKKPRYYAIHPGSKKILQACERALKITAHDNRFSYEVLRQHGNMSSATILFVLKKIWEINRQEDHQGTIFCCAFGPGLTIESMLLTLNHG